MLGARVPIILTSRADSVRARMASCAVGRALCPCPPPAARAARGVTAMDTILVVNAGSSSVKFQVFARRRRAQARAADQGADGRHRHAPAAACGGRRQEAADRPILSARAGDGRSGRAAVRRAPGCARRRISSRSRSGIASCTAARDYDRPVLVDGSVLARSRALCVAGAAAPAQQPCADPRAARPAFPTCRRSPASTPRFIAATAPLADHYAIPEHLYEEGVRRYGFHGLSYEYIARPSAARSPRTSPTAA